MSMMWSSMTRLSRGCRCFLSERSPRTPQNFSSPAGLPRWSALWDRISTISSSTVRRLRWWPTPRSLRQLLTARFSLYVQDFSNALCFRSSSVSMKRRNTATWVLCSTRLLPKVHATVISMATVTVMVTAITVTIRRKAKPDMKKTWCRDYRLILWSQISRHLVKMSINRNLKNGIRFE